MFDDKTKQKRFMSPMEQFLSEQTELFKQTGPAIAQEDQASATMDTNASTNFNETLKNRSETSSQDGGDQILIAKAVP
jgi:hypothetical protein